MTKECKQNVFCFGLSSVKGMQLLSTRRAQMSSCFNFMKGIQAHWQKLPQRPASMLPIIFSFRSRPVIYLAIASSMTILSRHCFPQIANLHVRNMTYQQLRAHIPTLKRRENNLIENFLERTLTEWKTHRATYKKERNRQERNRHKNKNVRQNTEDGEGKTQTRKRGIERQTNWLKESGRWERDERDSDKQERNK